MRTTYRISARRYKALRKKYPRSPTYTPPPQASAGVLKRIRKFWNDPPPIPIWVELTPLAFPIIAIIIILLAVAGCSTE